MNTKPRIFLSAEWRWLVMLNYPVDPAILLPRLPAGTELDFWDGRTYVSMVGFRFLRTKVLGIPLPGYRDFDEVNLRFYVRRQVGGEWRRGVVFVKEIVPRWLIAFVARTFYNENYVSLPMRHTLEPIDAPRRFRYEWKHAGRWHHLAATVQGEPALAADDAEETFISEHYWGYAAQPDGSTVEYGVEHPRWRVWRCSEFAFDCDVAAMYGSEFAGVLSGQPSSAFVAEGSPVAVRRGVRLRAET